MTRSYLSLHYTLEGEEIAKHGKLQQLDVAMETPMADTDDSCGEMKNKTFYSKLQVTMSTAEESEQAKNFDVVLSEPLPNEEVENETNSEQVSMTTIQTTAGKNFDTVFEQIT